MFSNLIMAGVIAISSPNMDFPKVWEKIDGQWSYVGKVKEKPQVLFWLEKKTKTQSKNLLTNEIRKSRNVQTCCASPEWLRPVAAVCSESRFASTATDMSPPPQRAQYLESKGWGRQR